MTIGEAIAALWEASTGISLSATQREHLLQHPSLIRLGSHAPRDRLVESAQTVLAGGEQLKLHRWLEEADGDRQRYIEDGLDRLPPEPTVSRRVEPSSGTTNPPLQAATKSCSDPPDPPRRPRSGGRGAPLRSRDGMPQRPVGWELAKKIGPVQRYAD